MAKWYDYHTLYSNTTRPYSYSANGSLVGYQRVTEHFNRNGMIIYHYKVREDLSKYSFLLGILRYLPGIPSIPFLDNGTLESRKQFTEEDSVNPVKEIINTYDLIASETFWNFKPEIVFSNARSDGEFCVNFYIHYYPVKLGKVVQTSSTERNYENGRIISKKTEFKYDNPTHLQLTRQLQTQSDGSQLVMQILYPEDYTNTDGFIGVMKASNMVGKPVETVMYKVNSTGSDIKILSGKITTYKEQGSQVGLPDKDWFLETNEPVPLSNFSFSNQCCANILPHMGTPGAFSFTNRDARYPDREKFNYLFDNYGNVIQIMTAGNIFTSYLWDYDRSRPVAIVTNAMAKDVFHTSFEDAGSSDDDSKTGQKVLTLNYTKHLTTLSNGAYILSYWKRNGGIWSVVRTNVQITNSTDGSSGTYTINITGVTATSPIDELSFVPASATITTYSHDPVDGVTTITDANGNTTNFNYDNFGRLEVVRDNDKKIIKQFQYHYQE